MTFDGSRFAARVWVNAARSGLITTAMLSSAQAADPVDPAVTDLVRPASAVEIGAGYVSRDSFKFGQYNGLNKKGLYGIANVDLSGGGSYDSADATRWRVTGTDLGLDTRELKAEYGQQGRFRVRIGYNELQKNSSDTYSTPYLGIGSNTLTLPSSWLVPAPYGGGPITVGGVAYPTTVVNGVLQAPIVVNGVAQPVSQANMKVLGLPEYAADVAALRRLDLSTKRRRGELGFMVQLAPRWELRARLQREKKDGLQATDALLSSASWNTMRLPAPIHTSTNQFDASMAYQGGAGHAELAYYGSLFKNDVDSLFFQNAFQNPFSNPSFSTPGALPGGQLGAAPDNQFHQIKLSGGYKLSRSTAVAATVSYGRGTQNQAFLPSDLANTYPSPRASLDGVIVSKAASVKLSSRPRSDLNLSAALKYDDRDNRTPIATYQMLNFGDNGSLTTRRNTPFSRKLQQLNLDADYRLAPGQWLKAGVDRELIHRACSGAWYDCAVAPLTAENTYRAEWRGSSTEALSARLGYTYSKRRASGYDQDANILASLPQSAALDALLARVKATGYGFWGPLLGASNAGSAADAAANPFSVYGVAGTYDLLSMIGRGGATAGVAPWNPLGMGIFNVADRNRQKLRSWVNYNHSDTLSFQGGLDFNKDAYDNSRYGLRDAHGAALNMDASYSPSDSVSANVFYSLELSKSSQAGNAGFSNSITGSAIGGSVVGGCFGSVLEKNLNAKADPCLQWTANFRNKADTVGAGYTYKGLLKRKLDLDGSILFSRANTRSDFTGGAYAVPIAPGVTAASNAVFYGGAPTPEITTRLVELRLNAHYLVSKAARLRVSYRFQHLNSLNYLYDSLQVGSMQSVLPTNEQAPNHNLHLISLSYVYAF